MDGKFGKLAEVQAAIGAALTRCGKAPINIDGVFGNETSQAVKALVACPEIAPRIPPGSSAQQGAITQSVWRAVLPNSALPSVEQRAQTLVLTYEVGKGVGRQRGQVRSWLLTWVWRVKYAGVDGSTVAH